jgi:hypothetical protein
VPELGLTILYDRSCATCLGKLFTIATQASSLHCASGRTWKIRELSLLSSSGSPSPNQQKAREHKMRAIKQTRSRRAEVRQDSPGWVPTATV